MAKGDYLPKRDAAMLAWHDQFTRAMVDHGASLNFSPATIAEVVADNAEYHADYSDAFTKKAAAKAANAKKDSTRDRVLARARRHGAFGKTQPTYNEGLGKLFGIVGHEPSVDLKTAKPKFHGKDLGRGKVKLRYNKLTSHGVNIYCQRGEETVWKLLSRDLDPPFVDEREMLVAGKPELRRYRCRYVLHDEEIGELSDVVVVSCAP